MSPIAEDSNGVKVWDIRYTFEDHVLVGPTKEEAKWVTIHYGDHRNTFVFEEEVYDLDDFIRLDTFK